MRIFIRTIMATAAALLTIPVLTGTASSGSDGAGIALETPVDATPLSAPIVGAAGMSDDRLEDVVLTGPGSVGALTMYVERTLTSALDQSSAFTYSVERCDTAWVSDGETITCPTTPQVLRAPAPLGPRADVIELGGVGAGAKAHLKVRFALTGDLPSEAVGQATRLEFRIVADL